MENTALLAYFKEIYDYRAMVKSTVRKDLRGRYKASVLGFLWTFINPLMQLVIYTIVFSAFMKSDIEQYYLHLFVALVPWIFFSASLSGGSSLILQQQDMIKKVYFPRQIIPISYTITNFINMLLTFIIVFAALIISGRGVTANVLYLPLIMAIEFIMCLGITFLSSACTVYFRDLEHILGIITMAWQFATPVMYPIPASYEAVFNLNPMTHVIVAYRDILFWGRAPQMATLLTAFLMGLALLLAGVLVFNRLQRNFVEEL